MEESILTYKAFKIFVLHEEGMSITSLGKITGITHPYCHKILVQMQQHDLCTIKKEGNSKLIYLTKKGKKVKKKMETLLTLLHYANC